MSDLAERLASIRNSITLAAARTGRTADDVELIAVSKTHPPETIMEAIKQIDSEATGRVETREYSVRQPRFMKFALTAAIIWTIAVGLQLTGSMFRTFP